MTDILSDPGTFWCDRHTPHRAHSFTVGSDYGPTFEGRRETCPGLSPEEAFADQHSCADPGCPCGIKPGGSGDSFAAYQPQPHAHDVGQSDD